MAKIQIKSEKLTPFGGNFSIMEQFDALLAQTIDSTLGLRCTLFGYQYSEILRSLMCVYLYGGSCSEEIVDMVEAYCRHFYIRANRCSSFYDSMFALIGWKTVEINGISSHPQKERNQGA